jgi:general secretion pathway protein A
MYAAFFGLRREPFSIAPDPHFLFMSEAHREALAHLLYGLAGGGGFVLLTGEIGAGKTTVCRCFLDQVPAHCDVAYVFNPKLSVTELLQTVCDEFRIQVPAGASTIKDYVDALNAFLLRSHAAGRHSVLIIDEAQALSAELLEQLRLLTNLETAERKLLQIILIGQPELRTMLARPELEQLAQRVIARYHLPALTETETALYVRHRLAVAGLEGESPFDARALRRIHVRCGGVPRRINLLAGHALLGGYARGSKRIDRRVVDKAAREVFDGAPAPMSRRSLLALGTAGAAALAAAGLATWWSGRPASPWIHDASHAVASANAASARASDEVATPAQAASVPDASDGSAVLARSLRSESAAWRELAALWQLNLDDGEPCQAAQRQQVFCLRSSSGLALVRDLGRPGILTLHDTQGRPVYALLTGLDDDRATLSFAGTPMRVPLPVLAGLWRGEFAAFWRAPPGYREPPAEAAPGPLADWIGERLPGAASEPLQSRLVAFQFAHGLKPDGLAGPMTLIQINRASGIDEPRLDH